MYSPEMLNDPLVTIRCIQKELKGPDTEKVKAAQDAYKESLDCLAPVRPGKTP
jgi:hypothetical protein